MKYFFAFLLLYSSINLAATQYFIEGDADSAKNYYSLGEKFLQETKYDSALFYLEKVEKIFLNNRSWNYYVKTLNGISHSLRGLGNYDSSLVITNQALKFAEQYFVSDTIIAQIFNQFGYTYRRKSNYKEALKYSIKAKEILNNYTSIPIKSENYSLLGQINDNLGKYDSALTYFEKAVNNTKEIYGGNHPSLGTEYANASLTYQKKGDYDKAIEYAFKSLELKRNAFGENHEDVATIYSNIGAFYFYIGENDLALEYYLKGLSIELKLLKDNNPVFGYRYNNISMAYRVKGDYDKAIEYAVKSKEIMSKSYGENHPNYATIINNIGRIYSDKKEFDKALEYFQKSYKIFKDKFGDSHPVVAQIQKNIGETYTNKGEYQKGLNVLQQALAIRINSLGSKNIKVAETYNQIGENYYKQSNFDSSLIFFQKAILSSADGFNEKNYYSNPFLKDALHKNELLNALSFKAKALNKKFKVSNNVQDLKCALTTCQLCDELIFQIRRNYKSEWSKLAIEKSYFNIYEEGISTSLNLFAETKDNQYKKAAFEFAEKSKAGILLDAIAESNAKRFSNIPDSLIEKENQLKVDLSYYDTQIQKEKSNKKNIDSLKLNELQNALFSLSRQHEQLINSLEKNYHNYFHLKYQPPIHSLTEIENATLTSNSALLEYFVGDNSLYIFLLKNNFLDVKEISLNFSLNKLVNNFRESLSNLEFDDYTTTAQKLYSILISPIKNELSDINKVFIIPDGILNYLSFESLISKAPSGNKVVNFSDLNYLIKNFEISYYYSCATLAEFKANPPERENNFIGFAPVFDDKNTKTKIASVFSTDVFASTTRSVNVENKFYSALPESEKELKGILNLYQEKDFPGIIYTHSSAREELIKSDKIKNYKYIHIASHGFINEAKPKLSGILFTIEDSTNIEDGILYSDEIYNLNLNADLLVLSACESGLGKIVKGEGVIGLTRGFSIFRS